MSVNKPQIAKFDSLYKVYFSIKDQYYYMLLASFCTLSQHKQKVNFAICARPDKTH